MSRRKLAPDSALRVASGNGGRLVEFGGWSMPVQYTTIVDEHKAVRERVGYSTSATWAG